MELQQGHEGKGSIEMGLLCWIEFRSACILMYRDVYGRDGASGFPSYVEPSPYRDSVTVPQGVALHYRLQPCFPPSLIPPSCPLPICLYS